MRYIEDKIQEACVMWFDLQYPQISRLLHHSPNGGKRDAREGARFKKMGTRAGFPDLLLLYPSGNYHALLIEIKTEEKNSRQTESQKDYQKLAESYGYKYAICRSLTEFIQLINGYLKS